MESTEQLLYVLERRGVPRALYGAQKKAALSDYKLLLDWGVPVEELPELVGQREANAESSLASRAWSELEEARKASQFEVATSRRVYWGPFRRGGHNWDDAP